MKEVKLTKGYVAIVDDEDYDRVSNHKWRVDVIKRSDGSKTAYAKSAIKKKTVYLHRFVYGDTKGMHIDHIDGNPLNNSKSNLRTCTHSQNMKNRCIVTGASSQYKGVTWDVDSKKWRARICANKIVMSLGLYESEEEASRVYDMAAAKYFGDFARTNKPVDINSDLNVVGAIDGEKARVKHKKLVARLASALNMEITKANENGANISVAINDCGLVFINHP